MNTLVKVTRLTEDETKTITVDARVVAIRWDLIPWCLALDLDVPESEIDGAPMSRAWVVFQDVSELYWPLLNARLPNGCGLTSEIAISKLANDFYAYSFWGLLPSFYDDGTLHKNPAKEIKIKAKGIAGLISSSSEKPTDCYLDRQTRLSLASDEELLWCLNHAGIKGSD